MLAHDRLIEALDYDRNTGCFQWKKALGNRALGANAGTPTKDGYVQIRLDGVIYFAHRLAWMYVHGRWPEPEADHKNRQRNDNRISNLREASHSQNGYNSQGKRSKTGARGVYFEGRTGRFYAQIRVDGKRVSLGTFDSVKSASRARKKATLELHKQFGRLD